MMRNIWRFFIRVSAFVTKELVSILRQTPLIMTLVLGPFLIMLLFGIGYRNQPRALRTLFVIQDNSTLRQEVVTYAKSMGPQLIYAGTVSDPNAAMQALRQGRVDLVVQVPSDAMQSIQNSKQVVISLYHNEIDPNQVGYIQLFGNMYVNELNRRVLSKMVAQEQQNISQMQDQSKTIHLVNPDVVVAPFTTETHSVSGLSLSPVDFFAPAVIVLLLQHLAVTFAALAIVREQRSGTMELFHISPLNALETLLGKYLSYLFSGGLLVAVITVTTVFVLQVPMQGQWLPYILVVAALLFAALGFGFLFSLAAKTELQAVQYSMFMLLGSVFFSGFFLDLRYLWLPVRTVSWMLPATYGIRLLQDIMLRGEPASMILMVALLAIGAGLFFIDWLLLRRRLHREWS
jgi:ABC-2 type transport system permease protein